MPSPYKLRKVPKQDLYWVVSADGKKHSKEGLPKKRAEAQVRALYASESRRGGVEPDETIENVVETSPHQESFAVSVPDPEPVVSREDTEAIAYGSGSSAIQIRNPTGYKSPAIRAKYVKRAKDEALMSASFRRQYNIGLHDVGDLI